MITRKPGLTTQVVNILVNRGWLKEDTGCPNKIADAIADFQRWAGIPQTGDLNGETLSELDAPRFCALPDQLHAGLPLTLCKWPDGNVPYFVEAALPGLTLTQTWSVFEWALSLWAGSGRLVPSRAASSSSARIVARVKRLDGPNGVLAQSQLPCGAITRALQDYDSSENWTTEQFARLVVAHEVGHALGIDHAPARGSLMSPYYDATISGLQPWDIAEIVRRYGVATPAPAPPVPPSSFDAVFDFMSKTIFTKSSGWKIEVRNG